MLSTWHGDYGDLYKRKDSDKVLHDKAFTIAKNVKYSEYQRGFFSLMV